MNFSRNMSRALLDGRMLSMYAAGQSADLDDTSSRCFYLTSDTARRVDAYTRELAILYMLNECHHLELTITLRDQIFDFHQNTWVYCDSSAMVWIQYHTGVNYNYEDDEWGIVSTTPYTRAEHPTQISSSWYNF